MCEELTPQKHDRFHCEKCGMEIEVIRACGCENGCAEFRCCGQDMSPSQVAAAESSEKQSRNIYTA